MPTHRQCLWALTVVICATTLAQSSAAQAADSWKFTVAPYGWISGLGGRIGIGNLGTNVDLTSGDVLDHLQFAAMADVDARKGPAVITADVIYVSVGGAKAFAVRGVNGDVSFDQHQTILQAAVGYTLINRQTWGVDGLVGARYWNLSAELGIDPANRDARARSGDRNWADAIGAARVHFQPASKVHLLADGDAGGGGSHFTWHAAASAIYDLSNSWGVLAGYKYLAVDYDRGGFLFNTHLSGPLLGATYSF